MEEINAPVKNKEALLQLIHKHANTIKDFGVAEFAMFGSFVRNDMNENSDIDFLVEFYPDKKTYKNFIHLAYYLEDLCGRKIELVTKKGLSKYIGPKILAAAEYVAITN